MCEILEPILANEAKFDSTLSQYMAGFQDIVKPCMFGDGNMQSAIPID